MTTSQSQLLSKGCKLLWLECFIYGYCPVKILIKLFINKVFEISEIIMKNLKCREFLLIIIEILTLISSILQTIKNFF